MDKREMLKGVLLVAFGASSYGMLAVFVKMAYSEEYTPAEITLSQVLLGVIAMGLINLFQTKVRKVTSVKIKKRDLPKLLLLGTTLGFTSLFYYLSLATAIDVSIAIVLLMQTVWMSVVLEAILSKAFPPPRKIISVVIVLAGTLLATNLIGTEFNLDWRGVFWGLLAAMSFTTTMFTSNKIATYLPAYKKSFIMLLGGLFVICIYVLITYSGSFNFAIFLKWGLIFSLFGTILPPIMLNAGFPKTGLGLGSIVASVELPVSVMMAFFLLRESVNLTQFVGIGLILAAIVVMNINLTKK